MKKLATYLLGLLSIFSVGYYSAKFYTNKFLNLEDKPTLFWIILLTIMLVTLVLGIYNCYKIGIVENQNKELIELVKELREQSNENCNNVLDATYNSRDINLDIYELIKDKDKEKLM
jgi:uncharacterized membrane protein affecting hemolysin expression